MRRAVEDARDDARAVTAASCENAKAALNRRVDAEVDRLEAVIESLDGGGGAGLNEEAIRLYTECAQEAAGAAEQSQLKVGGCTS